mmetsp:Transcript_38160/g.110177  ORF Transcript_38160/g.110177 Transcript_38160/m.110177 type:complete len:204 (-) Transcript_38160:731-1342(-)
MELAWITTKAMRASWIPIQWTSTASASPQSTSALPPAAERRCCRSQAATCQASSPAMRHLPCRSSPRSWWCWVAATSPWSLPATSTVTARRFTSFSAGTCLCADLMTMSAHTSLSSWLPGGFTCTQARTLWQLKRLLMASSSSRLTRAPSWLLTTSCLPLEGFPTARKWALRKWAWSWTLATVRCWWTSSARQTWTPSLQLEM